MPSDEPDHVGRDVVRERRPQVEHVVGDRQAAERDRHADAVEHEEQRDLAAGAGALALGPGPVPVAEVGDDRRDGDRDRLGRQRLVLQHAGIAGVAQQVEQPDVDDEPDRADHAELGCLADEASSRSSTDGLLGGRTAVAGAGGVTPGRPAYGPDRDRERRPCPTRPFGRPTDESLDPGHATFQDASLVCAPWKLPSSASSEPASSPG